MGKNMNNQQLDAFLEQIAKRIENEATTTEEAAEIVRSAKNRITVSKKGLTATTMNPNE